MFAGIKNILLYVLDKSNVTSSFSFSSPFPPAASPCVAGELIVAMKSSRLLSPSWRGLPRPRPRAGPAGREAVSLTAGLCPAGRGAVAKCGSVRGKRGTPSPACPAPPPARRGGSVGTGDTLDLTFRRRLRAQRNGVIYSEFPN